MNRMMAAAATALTLIATPALAVSIQEAVAIYERGDYPAAMKAFRALADQGNANAQFNIAVMYEQGQGVTRDLAQAFKWYRLAAAQGFPQAQATVAMMYDKGSGVERNPVEAVKWFKLAAGQGNFIAQAALGSKYLFGRDVPVDYVRAYMWFSFASAAGSMSGTKGLELAAEKMTPAQIDEAKGRVEACKRRNFKACD